MALRATGLMATGLMATGLMATGLMVTGLMVTVLMVTVVTMLPLEPTHRIMNHSVTRSIVHTITNCQFLMWIHLSAHV